MLAVVILMTTNDRRAPGRKHSLTSSTSSSSSSSSNSPTAVHDVRMTSRESGKRPFRGHSIMTPTLVEYLCKTSTENFACAGRAPVTSTKIPKMSPNGTNDFQKT